VVRLPVTSEGNETHTAYDGLEPAALGHLQSQVTRCASKGAAEGNLNRRG